VNIHSERYDLGPAGVVVRIVDPQVLAYLREFYTVVSGSCDSDWTMSADIGTPVAGQPRNRWDVQYRADPLTRTIRLRAADPANLAVTARKCVREILIDACEQRRYVMLHASAVVADRLTVIIVGDKGSGKTTLALRAALDHGLRYLSNDHLIVYPTAGGPSDRLTLTSLPTFIPLKIGTYLDLEPRLPPPWDAEGLDIDAFRPLPRERVYPLDLRVLYTFRRLGQANPITLDLDARETGPEVLVVLASYGPGPTTEPEAVGNPIPALLPHVRADWMFDPDLNQRHLPRTERQPNEYARDAHRLVAALAARSTVVAWRHQGDLTPLLRAVTPRGGQK
jgi:hypothetical protein